MADLDKIMRFAQEKHAGQKRKNGDDYITHPLKVGLELATRGFDEDYVITGIFHDLLEDTDATEQEILELSSPKVLEAVKLLTKTKEVSSKDYIKNILTNPIAKAVKNIDRIQNLQDAMEADEDFAKRYAQNTKEYYVRKFSKELDRQYETLCEKLGITEYTYVIDGSVDEDCTPIYKETSVDAWEFNKSTGKWEPTDPYFWLELEDDASPISEEKALFLIQSFKR